MSGNFIWIPVHSFYGHLFSPEGGPKSAFGSAVACGILLGVFEGVGVLLNRAFSEANRQTLPPCESLCFKCNLSLIL